MAGSQRRTPTPAEWAPAGHAEGSVLALGAAAEGEEEGGGQTSVWRNNLYRGGGEKVRTSVICTQHPDIVFTRFSKTVFL